MGLFPSYDIINSSNKPGILPEYPRILPPAKIRASDFLIDSLRIFVRHTERLHRSSIDSLPGYSSGLILLAGSTLVTSNNPGSLTHHSLVFSSR